MKNTLLKIIFFSLILVLWAACRPKYDDLTTPNPTTAEPTKKPWQTHPSVLFENFSCVAAYADSSKMYVLGHNYFMEFDSTHRLVKQTKYRSDSSRKHNEIPYVGERFFAYWDYWYKDGQSKDSIVIHRTDNPAIKYVLNRQNFSFYISGSLTDGFSQTPFCTVMGNKLLLFFYTRLPNSQYKSFIAVCQINDLPNSFTVDYQYSIEIGQQFESIISNIYPKNEEELYIGTDTSKIVNIRTRSITPLSPFIAYPKIGKLKDTLYFLGRNERNGLTVRTLINHEWKSYDFGEAGSHLAFFHYFFTNNQCIGMYNNAIAHFQFTTVANDLGINYREIDRFGAGLIKQVIRFKDRMYIISENGLYYKPLSEWLVYR